MGCQGSDAIYGGHGDDFIIGDGENSHDPRRGYGANDFLIGGRGMDEVWGGAGDDRIDTRDNDQDFITDREGSNTFLTDGADFFKN